MLHDFIRLRSLAGGRHILVPSPQIQRWDEASARARLREAAKDDAHLARGLRELAESLGWHGRDLDADIIHVAAAAAARFVALDRSGVLAAGTAGA